MGPRALLVGAVVAALVGCGGGSGGASQADRQWLRNATTLVAQLRSDEVGAAAVGTVADARRELHDESDLYVLLVAYTDFGGCGRMLSNTGASGPAARRADRVLDAACAHLERAAALFTRSTSDDDPRALVAAAGEAQRAWPLLNRATLLLGSTHG